MGRLLDRVPLPALAITALFLGLAPFVPQPHLSEKLAMLSQGALSRPLDIFDLFSHAAAPVLLVLKLLRRTGN